jgi:hypothetical protein
MLILTNKGHQRVFISVLRRLLKQKNSYINTNDAYAMVAATDKIKDQAYEETLAWIKDQEKKAPL